MYDGREVAPLAATYETYLNRSFLFGQYSPTQFHGTISLSAGHSKKCTNTVSIQIAAKNLLVCPGLPVESEEICVCVWQLNVDG